MGLLSRPIRETDILGGVSDAGVWVIFPVLYKRSNLERDPPLRNKGWDILESSLTATIITADICQQLGRDNFVYIK